MAFVSTRYQADNGDIHPIRLSLETAAAAGAAPTGDITSPIRAKVSKTNREFGLRPRGLVLSRDVGTAPDIVKRYKFLPILTATAFQNPPGGYTINGVAWEVVGKEPEDY